MVAVDEIHVGMAGRAEQDRSASSVAGGGVSSRVVFSEVGLDLNNASSQMGSTVAHQNFTQKIASDPAGIASEKGAIEWDDGSKRGWGGHG